MEEYSREMNEKLALYLEENNKKVSITCLLQQTRMDEFGITRFSDAFNETEIGCVVNDRKEKELTYSSFHQKTKRIAFLATKADKRRALAWLYYQG